MKLPAEMRTIPLADRALYNAIFFAQHFAPENARLQGWRDRIRLRLAEQLRRGGRGKVIAVERVQSLTAAEFRSRYLATGTPVVIDKGASEWPCHKEWSFEAFRERFGEATLKLVHHQGLSDDDILIDREYTEEMRFGDFLDQALQGGLKYMRFSPILEMFPELIDDFDMSFLRKMPGPLSLGTTFEAFIGGRKTFTPLHTAPTPFFFVNACGVKRWVLIPNHYLPILNPPANGMSYTPSEADIRRDEDPDFPGLESVDRMEVVLEPGDLFFMPSWLWHAVQNETPTIGVRCGFLYPKSMFSEAATLFMIRVFAARNPSMWKVLYYTLLRRNLPERDTMLLQPKLYWNFTPLQTLTESAFVQRLVGGRGASGPQAR